VYLRMLEDTVRSLKGEARGVVAAPPEVLLDRAALLPDAYVRTTRRSSTCTGVWRAASRVAKLKNCGGNGGPVRPAPAEAEALVALTQLRVIGARLGLETVLVRVRRRAWCFRAGAVPRLANLTAAMDEVQFDADVRRAAPLVMKLRRLGGMPLVAGLVRALSRAVDETTQIGARCFVVRAAFHLRARRLLRPA